MNPAHSQRSSLVRTLALLAATFGLGAALSPAWSQTAVPDNLGSGLKELVQSYLGAPERFEQLRSNRRLDFQGDRVLVVIYPDGRVPLAQLLPTLQKLGAQVVAVNAHYRAGAISAYLPLGRAAEAGQAAGVSAVALSHKPVTSVGLTTSQGAVVHTPATAPAAPIRISFASASGAAASPSPPSPPPDQVRPPQRSPSPSQASTPATPSTSASTGIWPPAASATPPTPWPAPLSPPRPPRAP
ncbi:hypothetical protein [Gloeobacter violaceus]|uniref:Gll3665 protein n=1 Tax=Gloeobacter violaceus (strain ATCC 29082 / PCC 7421) TaxID=251221 RepID=Q7NF61_GLOVI|nr:hypothetical protein [Gloeobacter violaceus]BAC91606.1 gll3665 [Gloeobacter violaceus PCC 7421]